LPRLAAHSHVRWLAALVSLTCAALTCVADLACATAAPAAVPSPRGRDCRNPAQTLEEGPEPVWNAERRRAVTRAFDNLPGPPSAGPRLAARLDAQATAWIKARAATCHAARPGRAASDEYTAAAACQYGVLRQHAALARRITQAPADSLARAELSVADLAVAMQDGSWAQAVSHAASEPAVSAAVAAALRPQVQIFLAWGSWLRGQDQKASLRLGELVGGDPLAQANLAELRLFTRGVDDPDALTDGAAALAAYRSLLGPADRRVVRVHRELARRHRIAGRLDAAVAELEAALKRPGPGADDPLHAALTHELGDLEHLRGDYRTAALRHQAALDVRTRSFGSEQLPTAESLFALGNDLEGLGELRLAVDQYARAVEIQHRLDPDGLATARTYNNLGRACYADRNFTDARRFHAAALEIRQRRLGIHHPDTATSLNNLGAVARAEGDMKTALELFNRSLEIRERLLGPDHPYVAISLNNIAELYAAQGRDDDAIALHERALKIRRARFGEDHPETARSLHNLGVLLMQRGTTGDLEAARAALTSAGKTRASRLGIDHPETVSTMQRLAELPAPTAKKP
jgi:tetratricopeptide (TPR) repeat protein